MIAGLEDISEGEIRIDGDVVNDKPPRQRDIAMVFQNYALYPHMTVRENIAFPLKLSKVDPAAINRKVEEVAQTLDLTQHLDRKPANLSGGQRQRVAMGRAIVREPKAFLMDEPLSNLDAQLRIQMRTEVSRLQDRLATTTVYVTHDQIEAMTLGDRVTVMRAGVIQQVDHPDAIYARPANLFVAGFMGSPPMNFLPARHEDGLLKTSLGDIPLPDELRTALGEARGSGNLIAGIRPEHLEDASLVQDGAGGVTFKVNVDLVESLGSEVYIYFTVGEGRAEIAAAPETGIEELPRSTRPQMVARLEPNAMARRGGVAELWFDPRNLHLFDGESGKRIGG